MDAPASLRSAEHVGCCVEHNQLAESREAPVQVNAVCKTA